MSKSHNKKVVTKKAPALAGAFCYTKLFEITRQ